jgi:hypothetical protein
MHPTKKSHTKTERGGITHYLQEPDTTISSHRTITIFCPARSSLVTMLAKRPRRWSRPSMTFVSVRTMVTISINNMMDKDLRAGVCRWCPSEAALLKSQRSRSKKLKEASDVALFS